MEGRSIAGAGRAPGGRRPGNRRAAAGCEPSETARRRHERSSQLVCLIPVHGRPGLGANHEEAHIKVRKGLDNDAFEQNSREPRAESREPRAESREPRAESREPRASSCPPGRVMPRLSGCRPPGSVPSAPSGAQSGPLPTDPPGTAPASVGKHQVRAVQDWVLTRACCGQCFPHGWGGQERREDRQVTQLTNWHIGGAKPSSTGIPRQKKPTTTGACAASDADKTMRKKGDGMETQRSQLRASSRDGPATERTRSNRQAERNAEAAGRVEAALIGMNENKTTGAERASGARRWVHWFRREPSAEGALSAAPIGRRHADAAYLKDLAHGRDRGPAKVEARHRRGTDRWLTVNFLLRLPRSKSTLMFLVILTALGVVTTISPAQAQLLINLDRAGYPASISTATPGATWRFEWVASGSTSGFCQQAACCNGAVQSPSELALAPGTRHRMGEV